MVAPPEHVYRDLLGFILVRWRSPCEIVGIEGLDDPQDGHRRLDRPERVSVGDVHLSPTAQLACVFLERGLKVTRPEGHTRQSQPIQRRRECVRIHIWRTEQFERPRGPPSFRQIRSLEQHHPRVHRTRVERGEVGAGLYEREARPVEPASIGPPFTRDHIQVTPDAESIVSHPRDLAHRQPVAQRERVETDERLEPFD